MTVPFNSDPMLRVELWDDDVANDDNIGMGMHNIAQYLSQQMDSTGKSLDIQFLSTFSIGENLPEESRSPFSSTTKAVWGWGVEWVVEWAVEWAWVVEWEWAAEWEEIP